MELPIKKKDFFQRKTRKIILKFFEKKKRKIETEANKLRGERPLVLS